MVIPVNISNKPKITLNPNEFFFRTGFTCGVAYCFYGEIEKGCYLDFSSKQCCGRKVCGK